jgi:hypothetical protein
MFWQRYRDECELVVALVQVFGSASMNRSCHAQIGYIPSADNSLRLLRKGNGDDDVLWTGSCR